MTSANTNLHVATVGRHFVKRFSQLEVQQHWPERCVSFYKPRVVIDANFDGGIWDAAYFPHHHSDTCDRSILGNVASLWIACSCSGTKPWRLPSLHRVAAPIAPQIRRGKYLLCRCHHHHHGEIMCTNKLHVCGKFITWFSYDKRDNCLLLHKNAKRVLGENRCWFQFNPYGNIRSSLSHRCWSRRSGF